MSDSVTKYYENEGWTTNHTAEVKDEVVERVKRKFDQRSKVGIEKYGTTLYDSPDGFYTFLNHLSEELMDSLLYIEKLKMQYGPGPRDSKD